MSEPLFQYRVKVSPKAKNLRLKVTVRHGLEVVLPQGYDAARVPAILNKKKHWINAALERAEHNRKFLTPEPQWQLPPRLFLPAIGRTWHVSGKASAYRPAAVREVVPGRLLVFGDIADGPACMAALQRWLLRQARQFLVPMLREISQKTGLGFNKVMIKRQRTRWASCSRRHTISLNAKLLFLDPALVEYCIVHELCHVAQMNHSRRFWLLVRHHLPNYQELDIRLRDAWKNLPRWV